MWEVHIILFQNVFIPIKQTLKEKINNVQFINLLMIVFNGIMLKLC
jgi:hypothetical protein